MEEDFYVPGFTNSLRSGEQSLPTAQPVQTAAYTDDYAPLDLGDWSIATMQNLYNNPAFSTAAVDKYIADQAAAGNEVVSLNPYASSTSVGPDSINANIWNAYNKFNPANPETTTGEVFRFDLGKNEGAAPAVLSSGTGYTLTDGKGGTVIGTASTPEEMQALVDQANAQKYGWQLYRTNAEGSFTPGSQLFGETDTRPDGVLGALVNYGLPIAVGLLTAGVGSLPALGWAPTAAIMGATGLTSGVLGGKTIDDALLQGAITGGTAGLLKAPVLSGGNSIGNVIGGALDKVPGVGDALRFVNNTLGLGGSATSSVGSSAFDQAFSPDYAAWLAGGEGLAPAFGSAASGTLGSAGGNAAANAAANEIVVNAARSTAPLLTGALSSIFGSGLLNDSVLRDALSGKYTATAAPRSLEEEFDGILVKANTGVGLNNLAPAAGGVVGTVPGAGTWYPDEKIVEVSGKKEKDLSNITTSGIAGTVPGAGTYYPDENVIEVQTKNKPTDVGDVAAPIAGGTTGVTYDPNLNEITVTVKPEPTSFDDTLSAVVGDVAPSLFDPDIVDKPPPSGKDDKTTLDKVLDYLKAAGLLSGVIGGLSGDKGKTGSLSSFAGMRGPLNPIFSAQLPAPNMQPTTPRSMGGTDWYRYGYGPEQSFFTNVPQGALNTSTAYTGYEDNAGRTAAVPLSFSSGMSAYGSPTMSAYGAPAMSFGRPFMSSGLSGTQQGPAAAALAASAPKPLTQEQRDAARRAQFDADWAKNRAQFTPEELAERDKRIAAYREEMSRWTPSPPTVAELPPAIDPTLLSDLYDRLGKLEALNQRYIDEYGVPSERLLKVAQGSYLADPENPAPFSAFKPKMDAYRTELQKLFGGQTGAGFIFGDPYQARRDLEQKLVLAEGIRNQIGTPGTAPEVVKNLREMYDRQLYELRQPIEMSKKYATPVTKSHGGSVGHEGYATGGYAVGGPGDGRDDKIPAMLSDGEYVMDAETVAMLGNGSSKAGAEALDKFRVNLRKHKGRKLSKGEFSVNAKKPEQYLKGRS